ncbi:MAG: Tetratricopeptide 4 [Actinoallomurus sp.]|nr:Tetratricopeptide 4 [Actinoallomurus sp.]
MTEDDLDDLEFDTLRTGDHAAAARRFVELAETVSGGVSRASLLLRAGEQWQHAGDHARAAETYRNAVADGGDAYGDPRVYLAGALFELDRKEEARGLIEQVRAEAPQDPEVYRAVAELLYEQGELVGAHDWCTVGADLARSADPDSLEGLLRIRYRSRLDLRWPEDEYDALLDELLKNTDDAPDQQFR